MHIDHTEPQRTSAFLLPYTQGGYTSQYLILMFQVLFFSRLDLETIP